MLDRLTATADELVEAHSKLDIAALSSGRVRVPVRMKWMALSRDVHSAVILLERSCRRAIELQETYEGNFSIPAAVTQEMWRKGQTPSREYLDMVPVTAESWLQAGLCFKTVLYTMRAYQDALYGALTVGLRQQASGSMGSAPSSGNRVGDLLRRDLPTFLPGFERWRSFRNDMKFGLNLCVYADDGEAWVTPNVYGEDGSCTVDYHRGPTIYSRDIVEALETAAAAARLAAGLMSQLLAR
jgi:hypothetical protein